MPHPKVAIPALVGLITTIVLAVIQGIQDPTTIAAAVATVGQAIIGYLTPPTTSTSATSTGDPNPELPAPTSPPVTT